METRDALNEFQAEGPSLYPSKVLYGDPAELQSLGWIDLGDLTNIGAPGSPVRVDLSSENVEKGLAQLVVGVVEVLRQVLERQAVRRMEAGSLTEEQVERLGTSLMTLEQRVADLCEALRRAPLPAEDASGEVRYESLSTSSTSTKSTAARKSEAC